MAAPAAASAADADAPPRSCADRAAEVLVIGVMPFLYGAQTRLPFIYYVIHLDDHFGLSWWTIGVCVACYQAARVVTSALSICLPRLAHLLGTLAGIAGFSVVLAADEADVVLFVAGTAMVGLSETMSSMQKYGKEMYKHHPNRAHAQLRLKYQYAFVMLGVVFAFSIGGFVYEYLGVYGVALFGHAITDASLFSLLVHWSIAEAEEPQPNMTEFEEGSFSDEESSVAARRDELKILKLSALISFTNDNYSTSQLPASWINWVICCTFGIEALTIGYNLSIGPIFLLNTFERGPGIIGVIFAVGEIIGTIFAVGSTCTGRGKALMRSIAKSPFDLCFAMGGIAVGVLVAAAPIFGLHVAGVFLLMSFNDLGATLMTELQASITTASSFAVLGPAGQVVRRAINVATALTGPVLFGWYPRMPYFVAGGVTIIWTVLLFVAFSLRRKQTVKTVAHQTGSSRRSVRHRMSFATGEVVHTMGKHHPSLSRLREEE